MVSRWKVWENPESCLAPLDIKLLADSNGLETDVAQSVCARSPKLEGRPFDLRHSLDVRFDLPLFCVAVVLNTHKTEHYRRKRGERCAPRATSLSVHLTVTCYHSKIRTFTAYSWAYVTNRPIPTVTFCILIHNTSKKLTPCFWLSKYWSLLWWMSDFCNRAEEMCQFSNRSSHPSSLVNRRKHRAN